MTEAASQYEIKKHYWNGWSNNMIPEFGGGGYIIHMFELTEDMRHAKTGRALCGAPIVESGFVDLNEVEPGCIRCRRILRKRGLLE